MVLLTATPLRMDQVSQAVADQASDKQGLEWVFVDVSGQRPADIRGLSPGALRQDLGSPHLLVSSVFPADSLGGSSSSRNNSSVRAKGLAGAT